MIASGAEVRHSLSRAISTIEPPADDVMSKLQANTAARSLERAQEHRQAMEDYATSYVEKLQAARHSTRPPTRTARPSCTKPAGAKQVCTRMTIVLLTASVATGCTSKQDGSPTAGPDPSDTSSSTSASGDTYGAPRVSNPLDATKFLGQPCAVLTQAQLDGIGVSRPGESDTDSEIARVSGPGCLWHARPEVNSTIDMSFLTGNTKGLSDTYRGRNRFKFFEETTVDGYPAVFNDPSDGRPHGDCNITVGISDTLTFRAREEGGLVGQAVCDRAKQVAAAVIATLKAGS